MRRRRRRRSRSFTAVNVRLARLLNIIEVFEALKAPLTQGKIGEMTVARQIHIQDEVWEPDAHPSFALIGLGQPYETTPRLKEVSAKTIQRTTKIRHMQSISNHYKLAIEADGRRATAENWNPVITPHTHI